MAKDRSSDPSKKEKKHKRDSTGSTLEESGISKKQKKDKKDKKSRKSVDASEAGDVTVADDEDAPATNGDAMDVDQPEGAKSAGAGKEVSKDVLVGAMVPFANPLADEKCMKKVLKGVKRGELLQFYKHPTILQTSYNSTNILQEFLLFFYKPTYMS